MELRTSGSAERAGLDKEQLVGPSRARTKLDESCGATRVCGAWIIRCLRVKQRQRRLRRKEFPYMEEREKTARKDRVALKRRYNKDIRLSLLYR